MGENMKDSRDLAFFELVQCALKTDTDAVWFSKVYAIE
jgi:hypothetical protein